MDDLSGPLRLLDNNVEGRQADPAWTTDVFKE